MCAVFIEWHVPITLDESKQMLMLYGCSHSVAELQKPEAN